MRQGLGPLSAALAVLALASSCTAIPSSTHPSARIAAPAQPAVRYAPPREVVQPVPQQAAVQRVQRGGTVSAPWLPNRNAVPTPRVPVTAAPPALVASIQALGRQFNGKVGIAVQSVDAGWTVSHNGDLLFPQQSVSKLWVAMTMLDAVDRGKLTLDRDVTIRPSDLTLFHQPIAALVNSEQGYTTSLRSLFERAMTQSDNTANDSVLRTVGGPEAVRSYLARRFIGTDSIRFGPGERLLQSQTAGLTWSQNMSAGRNFYAARSNLPRSVRERALDSYLADPPDGAAPLAIVGALARLQKGEMLSPSSTQILLATMERAKTGPQRIKAGVPAGWTYLHKTGTGQDLAPRSTGYNDVGIMTAPDGSSYAIAVMIGETTVGIPQRWELMQAVSRAVGTLHQGGARYSAAR
ncbi:beta-lactamase class A [Sphingobium sp. B2D3A]|uniref:class A beta-lactamase-related serine hydrolase n=1 Tax=unclassified Sphingobium TaxID=2611147 RepID=UPI0022258FE0|nr:MULTISPECIES: class A beta-lactamase-related serine hydrolase [unclassified Sphingobium]MCW2339057.1 beta-lactamase class A [Sphingobium sp. B2D3A]MCW2385482.1 beta-lactamase class A [Sphingobium sp. B2D3D]